MEGRIADGELRAEDAMHPCGRAQNCLIKQHFLAAARQGAMAARHDALLVAQYDMTAVGSPGSEERQKAAVNPLDMGPLAVARSYVFLVEGVGHSGFRVVQQAACREGKGDFARRPIFARVFDVFDQARGRRRSKPLGDSVHRGQRTSSAPYRRGIASRRWTARPRTPSRTVGGSKAGQSQTDS